MSRRRHAFHTASVNLQDIQIVEIMHSTLLASQSTTELFFFFFLNVKSNGKVGHLGKDEQFSGELSLNVHEKK